MAEWQLVTKDSPPDDEQPVMVWDGTDQTVGERIRGGMWFVFNSYGYNEDGEIPGVTHWKPLDPPPEVK